MPIAMRAALVPETPPPMITTFAGARPARRRAECRAALLLLQAMGADLHRHAPGDLAHRRQERQTAALVGDGLVSDRDRARAQQPPSQLSIGGEMQIGKQDLVLAQQQNLIRLRLLHLDDHLGSPEQFGDAGHDLGPGACIGRVIEPDPGAGAALDDDADARGGPVRGRCRGRGRHGIREFSPLSEPRSASLNPRFRRGFY